MSVTAVGPGMGPPRMAAPGAAGRSGRRSRPRDKRADLLTTGMAYAPDELARHDEKPRRVRGPRGPPGYLLYQPFAGAPAGLTRPEYIACNDLLSNGQDITRRPFMADLQCPDKPNDDAPRLSLGL